MPSATAPPAMPEAKDMSVPTQRTSAGEESDEFTPPGIVKRGPIDWVPPAWGNEPPGAARAAWIESSRELEPAAPPIPLLDLGAYKLIESIKLVSTPNGGQRLLLNGDELAYFLPEDLEPALDVDPAGGVGRLTIELLVKPEVKGIEYITAAQENA